MQPHNACMSNSELDTIAFLKCSIAACMWLDLGQLCGKGC